MKKEQHKDPEPKMRCLWNRAKLKPIPHRDNLCYFINRNTGKVSLNEPPFEPTLGVYICLSIYSLEAKNLLTRLKLEPFEVDNLIKSLRDV